MKRMQIFFVLIAFILLANLSTQQTTDYTQKVDNNIPEPTLIQVQPEKFNFQSQVTVPTIVQSPSIIYPLYDAKYDFMYHSNCTLVENDIQKKIGDYVKFKKGELGKFQDWNVQITDGTYDEKQQIVYALLTNGSIIKAPLRKNIEKQTKISKFERFDYQTNSTEQIWQLDKYELYASGGSLYLLKDRQLFSAKLIIEENKWQLQLVRNGKNIASVYRYKDALYIVKSKSIHQLLANGTISSTLISSSPEQNLKRDFIDMSIDNNYMYVLCKSEGVYLIDIANSYQIVQKYNYQFHEFAYKITVKNNTVLLNFKLYRKTYIGEFFFILSDIDSYPPAFRLNKFYYRQFFTYLFKI